MSPPGSYSSSGGESCAGSSSGSGTTGGEARTRGVTLFRRPPQAVGGPGGRLGFSLRGGKEHGTGFFVTAVEPGSEAANQGLRIGDQILRINGFPVEDATHKEVLHLIQAQNTISFKVKSVGMIPVKENPEDELSWQIVENEGGGSGERLGGGEGLCKGDPCCESRCVDVKMVLRVPPRAKLGCGICKGPEWKPGVFIQFTKENSIARLAGLRPGDQILQCNNFLFTPETPFNEAVSVMRCSGVLELIVRKGAGLELFPGESSGYNSSASSVAGDNPPRLATLTEETSGSSNGAVNGSEGRDEPLRNGRTEYQNGCTVIHVGGDETDNKKIAEICMVSQQLETKTTTVFVEVHHSEEDSISNTQSEASSDLLTNSSSVSSFTSSASSLSSAITQEIQRRSKQRTSACPSPSKSPPKQTDKLIKNGLAKEKVEQHEQLMMEFKKAHRKMFSSEAETNGNEEREDKRLSEEKRPGVEKSGGPLPADTSAAAERAKSKRQITPPPPPPLPVDSVLETPVREGMGLPGAPPPPPPSPPPYCPTPDYDTLSLASGPPDSSPHHQPQSGAVGSRGRGGPRGDLVEMQSLESFKLTTPSSVRPKPPSTYFNRGQESHNGYSSTASTVTMRDAPAKPLVTIREYPSGGRERKNPSKLEFLQQQSGGAGPHPPSDEPLACRLQSELCKTLSRAAVCLSNGEQCSEEVPQNRQNGNQPHHTSKGTVVTVNTALSKNEPFYLFPGSGGGGGTSSGGGVRPPTTAGITNGRGALSNGKLRTNTANEPPAKNSVTFNFSHKGQEVRNGQVQKNGILKNGNNHNQHNININNISQVQIQSQVVMDKIGVQKSIKFGREQL